MNKCSRKESDFIKEVKPKQQVIRKIQVDSIVTSSRNKIEITTSLS